MTDNFDFRGEVEGLLVKALTEFGDWAAKNWTMSAGEAETLTDPSPCPQEYERGYNAGVESIPCAVALWLEEAPQ